jgi:hypothetical protein
MTAEQPLPACRSTGARTMSPARRRTAVGVGDHRARDRREAQQRPVDSDPLSPPRGSELQDPRSDQVRRGCALRVVQISRGF